MKKLVALLLVAVLALTMCSIAAAEDKPTLKIMTQYQTYNFADQPASAWIKEMTGYDVEWYMLPAENAEQALLMQISAGEMYDMLMGMTPSAVNKLQEAALLLPLNDLVEEYGQVMKSHISDGAWKTVTAEDGTIYGLPRENALPLQEGDDMYGLQQYGLMFNMTLMKEMNLELPKTLDQFYAVCEAYTKATGKPAFTHNNNVWETNSIMPAFGMGLPVWYPTESGTMVHRLYHPGLEGYISFMQKMYANNLLDPDFPINSGANAKEKFCNGTSLCYVSAFFNYDNVASGFAALGETPDLYFVPGLVQNEGDKPVLYRAAGINSVMAIPYNSEHPVDAMKWSECISIDENFQKIYVGIEGEHHTRDENGAYWPVYPNFNDLVNSDKFAVSPSTAGSFQMWQARARKTPTIAASFAQVNEGVRDFDIRFVWETFAAGKTAVAENETAINTIINDTLMKLIVEGGDVAATIAQIKEEVKEEGWDEYAAAYADFYAEYADVYDWAVAD